MEKDEKKKQEQCSSLHEKNNIMAGARCRRREREKKRKRVLLHSSARSGV
jgi:hypothetical protein